MAQEVHHHTFANGLTLLAERMTHVRSAAVNFLVPAGSAFDPPRKRGLASALSDLMMRGAGERDNRQLTLALDNLGLDRSESVSPLHMRFWGATVATNLPTVLELYADIIRRPHLPKTEVDAVKALSLQELQSLEDDPQKKVLVELRRRHFPHPLGQDRRGAAKDISTLTHADFCEYHRHYFQPNGMIISVAGNIDWPALRDQVERLFGDWPAGEKPTLKLRQPERGRSHLEKDTAQTQIALAFDSVPFGHADYYLALGTVQVLSGGMSGRLFTEVREKRGLCYAVWATHQTFKETAAILCYAGTTNDRAQETLDVTLAEVLRLQEGIKSEEIERVQAGLKSSLIMQEESTSARAGALASDWYYLGRIRRLDEIQAAIDGLSPRKIVSFVRRRPPGEFTLVTLGPKALKFRAAASRVTN